MMKRSQTKAAGIFAGFLLLTVFFSACKGTQYTTTNLPEKQLYFGEGGGFTGDFTEYLLLENGQMFVKKRFNGEQMEIASTKKSKAKTMFKQAAALLTDSAAVNYPGNMYYFMQLKDIGLDVRLTWGAPGYEVNAQMKMLYDELKELVPSDENK